MTLTEFLSGFCFR